MDEEGDREQVMCGAARIISLGEDRLLRRFHFVLSKITFSEVIYKVNQQWVWRGWRYLPLLLLLDYLLLSSNNLGFGSLYLWKVG